MRTPAAAPEPLLSLADLLASDGAIPALPRNIALLLAEFGRDEPNTRTIAHLLQEDVGLTTRILKLVNSPIFRVRDPIAYVPNAIALLGLELTGRLVSAAAVGQAFKTVPGVDLRQFWRYSLDVGKLSHTLARALRLNPGAAFTCGLLHGVGMLILHRSMPQHMARLKTHPFVSDPFRYTAENDLLGYNYAEVGSRFADKWHLPTQIGEAIGQHCNPVAFEPLQPLAGVLHLACWRVRGREAALSEQDLFNSYPLAVADRIGLKETAKLQEEDPIDWTSPAEGNAFA